MKNIADWPIVRGFNEKLAARHDLEQNNVRVAAAKRISEIEAERDKTVPALDAAADHALHRIEATKLELRTAEQVLDAARRERLGAKFEFQAAIDAQRAVLRRTASPKINDAERELVREAERLRTEVFSKIATGFDTRLSRDVHVVTSNARDINAKQDAIRAALRRLDALRFEIIDDVDAAIVTIISNIPTIIADEEVRAVVATPREPERPRYSSAPDDAPNTDNRGLENLRSL
jgi:hypothetical protein